jgi:N-acetyl-alpha-D-glucosaminyl L-malate synthase BshA
VNEPLKIAFVCYSSLGGSGVMAAEIAAAMARRGHEAHLIASARPRRPLPQLERLHFHPVESPTHPLFDPPPYTIAVAGKIVDVARRHGLDVVHAHYAVPHAAAAHLAVQTLEANGGPTPKLVTTLHGTDVTQLGVDPVLRPVTAFTVAVADAVTTPSVFLRDETVRAFGLAANAIEVIPNFVDVERFAPPPRRDPTRLAAAIARRTGGLPPSGPFLVHVSNFRPVKRAADLLAVLARVRASLPAHLVLVGDGPQLESTANRARDLGLGEAVSFLGEETEVADVLRHADAMLLTSESESFGVAALEALSCGVPVFAYRVGGLPEVVGTDCGALVEPFDVDALATAIRRALSDGDLGAGMRLAARARALQHFRAKPILDGYERLYHRLVESERERE